MRKITTLIIVTFFTLSINAQSLKRHIRNNSNTYNITNNFGALKSDTPKNKIIFQENFDNWPLTEWGFYELKDTVGWTDLVSFGGQNGGYLGPNAAIHHFQVLTGCDDWMVSPAITINDESTMLSCWQHYFEMGDSKTHQIVALDGPDPSTATQLGIIYEGENYEIEYWEEISVSLADYVGKTIHVAFRYASDEDAYMWGIDELTISFTKPNDMTVTTFLPEWMKINTETTPIITVQNVGKNTQTDFDVKVEILNGSETIYSDSKSISGVSLAEGDKLDITMSKAFSASKPNKLTVKASVTLSNDDLPENDTLEITLPIVGFKYDDDLIYAYNITDPQEEYRLKFVTVSADNGKVSLLPYDNNFVFSNIYAGDFVGAYDTAIIYAITDKGIIYNVDADGHAYFYGQLSKVPVIGIYGFTWDQKTDSYFITDGTFLYSVDMLNLTTKKIGYISPDAAIVSIAADSAGNIYGLDIKEQKLYTIDKTTGAGTPIGLTGLTLNYAQDIGFDRTTNILYGTLYGRNGDGQIESGLYTFDTETGATSNISLFEMGNELSICAKYSIPENVSSINDKTSNISIYPNPTNGIFYINTNENYNIQVVDLTGKIVFKSVSSNSSACIDLSEIQNGIYIISLSNAKQSIAYKLIKE